MFNLFRSQKQTVRYLLGGILVLVALSMVITLVPGLYSDAAPTAANYVFATVGDSELTLQEVQIRFRDLQIGAEGDPVTTRLTALNTIDSMIMEKVLLQEAEELGLTPDEKEVAEWLKMQLPFLFPNGVFVGADQYAMFVRQRFQRSIPEFEAEVSRSLAIDTRLRRLIASSVIVTEEEARQLYRRQNEKTKVEFVKIAADGIASTVSPTDAQLSEYFTKNQERYRIPELRTLKLMAVDAGSMPAPAVAESEIDLYYGRNRSLYEIPERVRASHILFMTQGKSEEETAKIKAKAEEILKQVRSGGDFAAIAQKNSEDPVSAKEGGDLGWVMRGQMVPEFETATFSMQPGQISELVKTEFGFHIIKVQERERARLRPLEEVREEIRSAVAAEKQDLDRMRMVDDVIAAARLAGTDLEPVAQKFNLNVETYEKVNRDQPSGPLAGAREFLQSAFQSAPGQVFTETRENSTIIGVVTDVLPPRDAQFDEVRDAVRSNYVREETRRLVREHADQIAAKAKEEGSTLQRAAASFGLKTQTTDFIKPDATVPDLGDARVLGERAYTAAPGTIVGPLPAVNDMVIYRVVAHEEADMSGFEDQKKTLLDTQTQARRDEAYRIFQAAVRKRYEDEGKITRYQDRIDAFLQGLIRRG